MKYNTEEIKIAIQKIKEFNKTCSDAIDELNYVIGNLKVEYPTMFGYQNGQIILNSNFDFDKCFVTKEEVLEQPVVEEVATTEEVTAE